MSIQLIWDKIGNLDQHEMFNLLYHYNRYVIEVCDREDGSVPVCLPEYYTDDYQLEMEKSNG